MALLDRLRPATYKGAEFLVETSSITFGQKTVTHQYPNSNRTEVEFLGAAEDIFSLNIYIHSTENDYISKRNLLKRILESEGPGLLVHPYEGEIRCSVVGQVTLDEDDRNFGIARFSVTWQKTSLYLFPNEALNNIAKIRTLFLQLKNAYKNKVIDEYFFEDILPEDFGRTKNFLTVIGQEFEMIKTIVPLDSEKESSYNSSVETFNDNIVTNVTDNESLATDLDNIVTNLDGLASEQVDNVSIYQALYEIGTQALISPALTVQSQELNDNIALITNYINIMALGLSYNAFALVTFETDQDINFHEDLLEDQYDYIFLRLDSEIGFITNSLRNEITKFFEAQDVRRVIDMNVPGNPLTKLVYLLYDNLDDYEKIYELNNKLNPVWYEGDIKVLTIN